MEYTPQNLEYAVSVFYNGEQTERAQAHAWLTAAQRAPQAWNFIWELLQPNKGTEIQFYAATTLHTKILRCWNEVPAESYSELRDKILQSIFLYLKGPKIVTNRLCISLAAFILQQGAVDLVATLQPLSTIENSSLLLDVLTVIPEEFNSMTMGVALWKKNKVSLQQACPAVLVDMLNYLQSVYNDFSTDGPSEELVQLWLMVATCAKSWLTLGGEDTAEHCVSLPERIPLVKALVAVVKVLYTWNEAISDTALEACEACLSAIRAAGTTGDVARQPAAGLQLLSELAELAAPVVARDNVPNSINEELLAALITCVVAIVESHSHVLMESDCDKAVRQTIEVLLSSQAAPGHYPLHETRSSLLLSGLWCAVQHELDSAIRRSCKISLELWREVFSRLLSALVTKSEAPPDSALSKEEMELLRCYRQDIADNVMYCYCVLGSSCWSTIEASFLAADNDIKREAALHIFLALADIACEFCDIPFDIIRRLLQHAVNSINTSSHKKLTSTALECLGGYAERMSELDPGQGSLLAQQCMLAAGGALARGPASAGGPASPASAASAASPTSAALALRKLCIRCDDAAKALAGNVAQVALNPPAEADTWVRQQLLMAAGASLAAANADFSSIPVSEVTNHLIEGLRNQANNCRSSTGACEQTASFLAGAAGNPQFATRVFRVVFPTLPALAVAPSVVEPLFDLLQQFLQCSDAEVQTLFPDLAQLIITAFNTRPCGKGLDCVKLFFFLCPKTEDDTKTLVLHSCISTAARVVATDPSGNSDLTESLFTLLSKITRMDFNYINLLKDTLAHLIELACGCMRVREALAGRAACRWLSAACECLRGAGRAALQQRAPGVTRAALACIGGGVQSSQFEALAALLLSLNKATWQVEDAGGAGAAGGGLPVWLREQLAVADFPTPHATDSDKTKFITAVLREKTSKRRLLEAVQEFSLACRGLMGTEYARETMAAKQLIA